MQLRSPGSILLISCYELGHQPLGVALPLGFFQRAGYAPAAMDIAVEQFDIQRLAEAQFVGISVPMHTALRLGVRVAGKRRDRRLLLLRRMCGGDRRRVHCAWRHLPGRRCRVHAVLLR